MSRTALKKAPFPETNIAILRGPKPGERTILVKRRKKVRQGPVMGVAQPQEIEIIREFYPDVLRDAGIE